MWVELVLRKQGKEIKMKREVTSEGLVKYFKNNDKVSKEEYRSFIRTSFNVNYESTSSFVFQQGQLEFSPFMKGGYELTELLEQVSGSDQYQQDYESILSKNKDTEKVTINLTK
jgi:chromosome segregation ATPase